MEYLVLFFGWVLALCCVWVVHLVATASRAKGGVVTAVAVPAFMTALGAFAISTPKIGQLVFQYGEKRLELSRLENDIQQKGALIAELESRKNALVSTLLAGGKGGRQVLVGAANYYLSQETALSLAKEGDLTSLKAAAPDQVVILPRRMGSDSTHSVQLYNPKTQETTPLPLPNEAVKAIANELAGEPKGIEKVPVRGLDARSSTTSQ